MILFLNTALGVKVMFRLSRAVKPHYLPVNHFAALGMPGPLQQNRTFAPVMGVKVRVSRIYFALRHGYSSLERT